MSVSIDTCVRTLFNCHYRRIKKIFRTIKNINKIFFFYFLTLQLLIIGKGKWNNVSLALLIGLIEAENLRLVKGEKSIPGTEYRKQVWNL
jgi:hypothetical protein